MVYFWLIFSALDFAAGEAFSKSWANNPTWGKLVLATACYVAGALAWLPALRARNHLVTTGAIWSMLSLIATVGVGVIVFGEAVQGRHLAGLFAAGLAILYLS